MMVKLTNITGVVDGRNSLPIHVLYTVGFLFKIQVELQLKPNFLSRNKTDRTEAI